MSSRRLHQDEYLLSIIIIIIINILFNVVVVMLQNLLVVVGIAGASPYVPALNRNNPHDINHER